MNAPHIEAGEEVYTIDGKRLGQVKEVREDAFKIDVRWGRDYWLEVSEVFQVDGHKATLCIPADELNMHKLSRPGQPMVTLGGVKSPPPHGDIMNR